MMRRLWIFTVAVMIVAAACGGDSAGAPDSPTSVEPGVTTTVEGDPPDPEGDDTDIPVAQPSGGALAYVGTSDGEVIAVDPDTENVLWVAELEQFLAFIWAVDHDVWVRGEGDLIHLDASGDEVGSIGLFGASGLAGADGVIYVISLAETEPHSFLSKVDPSTHAVVAALQSEDGEFLDQVAVGGGSVWITSSTPTSNGIAPVVSRVDPDSMTVVGATPLDIRPEAMAWGEGALWVAGAVVDGEEGQIGVTRIGPDGAVEAHIITTGIGESLRTYNTSVAVGFGGVWVIDASGTELVQIDPATNTELARFAMGPSTATTPRTALVHVSGGRLWVDNPADDIVYALDPETNDVAPTIPYPGRVIAFRPTS